MLRRFLAGLLAAALANFGAAEAGIRAHGSAASTYPAAVVLSGTQAEYDMIAVHPGPIGSLVPAAGYCASIGSCPSGMSYIPGNLSFNLTSTNSVSGIDSTGVGYFVSGSSTTGTTTNAHLQSNGAGFTYRCTADSGATGNPALACNLDHFEMNGVNNSNVGEAPFVPAAGTSNHGWFHGSVRDHVDTFIDGGIITNSYFGMYGNGQDVDGHAEMIHARGSTNITHSNFNALDGGATSGGSSAMLQLQSDGSRDLVFNISYVLGIGNNTQGSHQPNGTPSVGLGPMFGCKAQGANIDVNVDHSAINTSQAGPGNYVTGNAIAQLGYTVIVGGPFAVNEVMTGGTSGATARFDSLFSITSPVSATVIVALPTTGTMWSGTFVLGETITGGTSGAHAVLTTIVQQPYCHIHDLGNNYDYGTAGSINLTQSWGYP